MNWWIKIWWKLEYITNYNDFQDNNIVIVLKFTQYWTKKIIIVKLNTIDYGDYIRKPYNALKNHLK